MMLMRWRCLPSFAMPSLAMPSLAMLSFAMAWRAVAAFMLAVLAIAALPVQAASLDGLPRVALVIGNAGYKTMPLTNPLNDARAIADALDKLGFKVIRVENASQKQMFDAVRQFGDALSGGVGLFYYAGHAVQVKGRNYLIPVDAAIEREDEVAFKAFNVSAVLEKMETAKNPLNIVILDACRNNPFVRTSRSATTGLAQMDAPIGSIVAFATAPGAEAADGSGRNGLYTSHLLKNMATPGLKIEDVFKRTRVAVKQDSAGRQIPWESTSLEGDFYFTNTGASPQSTPSQAQIEAEMWSLVNSAKSPSAYRAYLEKYPNGQYANEARSRAMQPGSQPADNPPAVVAAAQPVPQSRSAGGFSFSAEEAKMDRATPAGRDVAFKSRVDQVARTCAPARRNARLRVDIDEQHGGRSSGANGFALALNDRLRQAGFRVMNAGASDYVLRGTVTTQANANRMLALNELSVNAAITVAASNGQVVSSQVSREESYAGSDLTGTYNDIVAIQAAEVAGKVLGDLCAR
jgi:uncharacterized caspase-like protein